MKPKYKRMRGKIKKGFGNFPTNNKKFRKPTSKLFRKRTRLSKYEIMNNEVCFATNDEVKPKKKKDIDDSLIWVGDSGASAHMTNVWKGFSKVRKENSKVILAQPEVTTQVKFAGDWKGVQQCYRYGNKKDVIGDKFTLNDVMYVPTLRHNLFSITKGIANGGTLSNEGDVLTLKFKDYTIRFDYKIKTKSGHIMAAIINPIGIMQDVHRDDLEPVDINVFHQTTH